MCRVLRVHRSGYYAWLKKPRSARAVEDGRLLVKIRKFHQESGGAYGSPRIFKDLRDDGETCGLHRVARVMKQARVKAIRSYKKPRYVAGQPSLLAPNALQREFTVDRPNRVWVTDITYIRTWVRVSLSGRGDGPVLAEDHWLVHEYEFEPGDRHRRPVDGGLASKAREPGPGPFGPGIAVREL